MTDNKETLSNTSNLTLFQPTFIKATNKISIFPSFISPAKDNIRLHRLYVKRDYLECKEIIKV